MKPDKNYVGYVITERGHVLVQLPHSSKYGFALADNDHTWPGGVGIAKWWDPITEDKVSAEDRERLEWILSNPMALQEDRKELPSDDPAVWMVNEFNAESCGLPGDKKPLYCIHAVGCEPSLVAYCSLSEKWLIFGYETEQPLTRDDVRRLCELFGVEVKR